MNFFIDRVRSVQAVIQRARTVFLFANIATLVAMAALFNTYLSWIRHLPDRPSVVQDETLRSALLRAQTGDLMVVSVPVLGLKFFAADLGIIASAAMLILAIWLYYSFRREQHSVGRLILEVAEPTGITPGALKLRENVLDNARFILAELSSTFVFVTSPTDVAVGDLTGKEAYADEGPPIAVWAKDRLLEAPFWIVLICALADLGTLLVPSILPGSEESLWFSLSTYQQIEAVARIAVALLMAMAIRPITVRTKYFHEWTGLIYLGLGQAIAAADLRHVTGNDAS